MRDTFNHNGFVLFGVCLLTLGYESYLSEDLSNVTF